VRVQAIQQTREQVRSCAINAIEVRQIDIHRLASVQARLGILHRSHDLGRMRQVERSGGDEACVVPLAIRSNDDTHRATWLRKEFNYIRGFR
jgi:hypothetical protein